VKFPKETCDYTLEQAEYWYGLKVGYGIETKDDDYNDLYS
jgi:hypothetical protein